MVGVCQWSPVPGLEALLGQPVTYLPFRARELTELAVWGSRPSPAWAARLAARLRLPLFRVAPGFLRPLENGRNQAQLSVVIGDAAIPLSAGVSPRLEHLAAAPHSPAQRERARKLIQLWREGRISGFNGAREYTGDLPAGLVLVIDQPDSGQYTFDAPAHPSSFERMIETALAEHPDCTIIVKAAPARRELAKARLLPRLRVLEGDPHAAAVLERARAVYTVGSDWGFEALLWGAPVHTFGNPFFAGWGLTADRAPSPSRRVPIALEDLVHAFFVEYSRYRHPETGRGCEVEEILAWLALQRRMRERFPATLYASGFSFRKRRFVREFLRGSTLHFVRDPARVPPAAPLVVWGRRPAPERAGRIVRLEDGFLRSVGLGAGMARPLSWVVDRRGIYYDSTGPSDLERMLETMQFDPDLLARAGRLREAIIAAGITKYNLAAQPWRRPSDAARVILVPGQVETDASLRYGAPGVRTNLGLLQAVRAANPEAYVLYKPHPDVLAGLRARGEGEEDASAWCDEQVAAAPMGQLLLDVDEVHVLTSLAGFEAMLRGKSVTCYGQPFYAGWGLTTDIAPIARRTRKLSLDALVVAALIVYPTYISRVTNHFTTPERVIEELQNWQAESALREPGLLRRLARRLFRPVLQRYNERRREPGEVINPPR